MAAVSAYADWVAVDWGSTNLRAWSMPAVGAPLAAAQSDDGMARLAPAAFEPALLALIDGWLAPGQTTPVIACGMVGSRQGWIEAPYASVPCAPLAAAAFARAPATDPRLAVHLIPGLSQSSPADVMRGEETQIAGFLAIEPDFDGVLCLPGTHNKWARISAGEVVSFQTYMTGEMFALLATQSVLRHGIATEGWDDAAFLTAVNDMISRPDRISARLFTLRAEGLLAGLSPQSARARLSGSLIGAELAAARPYWLGQDIVLLGAPGISAAYATALTAQGARARVIDGDGITLAGLRAAHTLLQKA